MLFSNMVHNSKIDTRNRTSHSFSAIVDNSKHYCPNRTAGALQSSWNQIWGCLESIYSITVSQSFSVQTNLLFALLTNFSLSFFNFNLVEFWTQDFGGNVFVLKLRAFALAFHCNTWSNTTDYQSHKIPERRPSQNYYGVAWPTLKCMQNNILQKLENT